MLIRRPSCSPMISFAIFIDSSTTRMSPRLTASQSDTNTAITLPVIGALIVIVSNISAPSLFELLTNLPAPALPTHMTMEKGRRMCLGDTPRPPPAGDSPPCILDLVAGIVYANPSGIGVR